MYGRVNEAFDGHERVTVRGRKCCRAKTPRLFWRILCEEGRMRSMKKEKVANGIFWVEIPEADLRILCGCPADSVKHLIEARADRPGREGGSQVRNRPQRDPPLRHPDPEGKLRQPRGVPPPADVLPAGNAHPGPPEQHRPQAAPHRPRGPGPLAGRVRLPGQLRAVLAPRDRGVRRAACPKPGR